ncbi:MAG: molybdate ABC transporter substrate-binding protein [Gammaproteobacteria bacterium]|nr:molybdate ABC transporter substrate-binding protein [Gammaproteobacteria bacterium]
MANPATRKANSFPVHLVGACALGFVLLFVFAATSAAAPAKTGNPHEPQEVLVFAASSLTDALADIGRAYEEHSINEVKFSFASSSTLARQIALGAPAEVYISADLQWMDYVQKRGKIIGGTRINLLANQLALVAPADGKIEKVDIHDGFPLEKLLSDGRLAMGNPMHVPAGIYGKEALKSLHVWKSVRDQVARAANVRAALALVALGECPLGIVYKTDAFAADKVKIVGIFPAATHKPVIYPVALIKHAGKDDEAARDFFRFMTSDEAAKIFESHGFKVLEQ